MLSLEVLFIKELWLWGQEGEEPRVLGEVEPRVFGEVEREEYPKELGERLSWEGRLLDSFLYLILIDVLCLVPDIL